MQTHVYSWHSDLQTYIIVMQIINESEEGGFQLCRVLKWLLGRIHGHKCGGEMHCSDQYET